MNYSALIGLECCVEYVNSKYLNYIKWKNANYPTVRVEGKVIDGTRGILVLETKDNYIIRLDDSYVKFISCRIDVEKS